MTNVLDRESQSSLLTARVLRPTPPREPGRGLLSDDVRTIPFRLSEGEVQITIHGQGPSWLFSTLHVMQRLDRLEHNWDSYGAPRISSMAIAQALETLGWLLEYNGVEAIVVPTSSGDVQLEWHQRGVDLEIRCSASGPISAYFYDHSTGH